VSRWRLFLSLPVSIKPFHFFVPGEVEHAVEHALKVGYRHIDCADAYSNHKEVGVAFNKVFSDPNGPKREEVWITTKINNPDHEPSKVPSHTLLPFNC